MSRPAIKAGLVGGAAAIVANLIGLIPLCGCISLPLEWLAFAGAGVLAAAWLLPPRQGGTAAGQGAIAGLIAALLGGLIGIALVPVSLALTGGSSQIISQLPPEALQAFRDAGVDPSTIFGTAGFAGLSTLCCGIGLFIGAGLGALGGLIYAGAKPQ